MSNILRINNDYSLFISKDDVVKRDLFDRLRFRDKNYFHSRAYKMRKWDGYINFFSQDTGKFLTGLLPEVSAVLRHFNVEYTVDDQRTKTKFQYEKIDPGFLNQFLPQNSDGSSQNPIELYDYQVDSTNMAIKHRRGIVVAPTGAGKTNIMISFLKSIAPKTPILILQNRV